MTYFEGSILSYIEMIFWLLLIFAIFGEKLSNHRKAILAYVPIILLIDLSKWVLPVYATSMLLHVSFIVFIMVFFHRSFLIAVATAAYSSFLVFAAQGMVTGFLSLFVELEFTFINGLIIMSMLLLLGIYVYLHVPLYLVTEALEKKRIVLTTIAIISLSFLYFMLSLEEPITITEQMRNLGLFLLALSVVAVNVFAATYILESMKKKEALKKYNTIEMMMTVADHPEHLEKNLQLIYYLAIMDDFDKNEYHIRKYLHNFRGNNDLMKLRNKPLAMYLYVKMIKLRDEGITCRLTIDNYFIAHNMKSHTLLQAIDILITNAVEASKDKDKKIFINITHEESGRKLLPLIEVLNKHKEIWHEEEQRLYEKGFTTKRNQKGIGLYKLSMLSKKNEFDILFTNRKIKGENYVCFGIELIN